MNSFPVSLLSVGNPVPADFNPGEPAPPVYDRRPLTEEKLRAGVKIPAFLPYFDDMQTAGETPEMRYAYRRMLADPTIKASFCAKIFSVMAQDLVVGPPKWLKKDARSIEIAEFVEWNLTAGTVEGVPGLVWDILSGGLIDGFSVSEKVWGEPEIKGRWRGKRRLAALKAKDVYQDLVLEIDEFKNIVGVKGLRYNAGQTFDPADFVIYSHLGLFENPTGMSDFRAVYGKWWLLDTVWKLRAIACDKRSMPIMVGHWKDVSQQRTLEASLSRVRYQNWITAPEEAKIEALNIAGQADQIFKDTIRDLKEDIVTGLKGAILTQMTSADQRGDSQVHEGTSNAFEWYLSAAVLNVLNGHESGLIRHIVDVNYQGVGDYPRASFGGIDDAELKESLNIDRTLWDMGWPLDQDEMETRYGRKWQADPQKAIKKPDGGGGPPGADGGALAGMMGGGGPPPDGDGGQQPPEGDAPPDQPGQPGGGDDTDQNGLLADILSGVMGGDDEAIDAMDGDQQDAGQQEDDDTRESLIADIMSGAMGDDDDALDALHGDDHHQFAESEPGGDDGYNLAEFYAAIWNAKTSAGLDVTDKEIDAAQDELAPFGWHLGHTGEKWAPEREPHTFAEQARAPKGGIHVAGKWFPGGRWIPGPVMAQATPAERAAIEEPQEKRKAERKARGTVDTGKIRKLIGDAATATLSEPETRRANRTFRALKSHHGDLLHHRLEELAKQMREAHDAVDNDVQREFFAKQLAAVGVMLDKAGDAPEFAKKAVGDFEFGADEADRPAAVDSPKEKELWEMTREELLVANKDAAAKNDRQRVRETSNEIIKRQLASQQPTRQARTELQKRNDVAKFDYVAPSSLSLRQILDLTDSELEAYNARQRKENAAGRRKLVEDALAAGESVPPEVLADYPDLTESAAKTPQGATPPSPGFTGIDANGHKWVDGEQVKRDDLEDATTSPGAVTETGRPLDTIQEGGNADEKPVDASAESEAKVEPPKSPILSAEISSTDKKKVTWPWYGEILKRVNEGTMTPEELKERFNELVADPKAVKENLAAALKRSGLRAPKKIAENADYLFEKALHALTPDKLVSFQLSMSEIGNARKSDERKLEAYREAVESIDADHLAKVAAERKERVDGFQKAVTNPETLREFETFIAKKGESALTPEQRAAYDDVVATDRRERDAQDRERRAVVAPVTSAQGFSIHEGFHTKRQRPIHVVKLENRVGSDEFKRLAESARKLGGNYQPNSRYSGGKTPDGFNFDTPEAAERFGQLLSGQAVSRMEDWDESRGTSKQNAAERLRTLAEGMKAKAADELGRDRLTNTARRADMAASAESRARAATARAETIERLADKIASGETKHLDGMRTGTQIDAIDSVLRRAQYARQRAENSRVEEPLQPKDIEHAKYPHPYFDKGYLLRLVSKMRGTPGAKRMAERINKVAAKMGDEGQYISDSKFLADMADVARNPSAYGLDRWQGENVKGQMNQYMRLQAADIKTLPELRAALREYLPLKSSPSKPSAVKEAERRLIGRKIPGFFPTPRPSIDDMISRADIRPGMTVLEPSAGKGDILDAVRESVPDAKTEAAEINGDLRSILQAKGHNLVAGDFKQHSGQYDRILMNPPFEDYQDADHVQHAYGMLKPGGKLVAIMSQGPFFRDDSKGKAFRQWLDSVRGDSEDMPEGSFSGKDAFRQTGVRTRMVTITKPDDTATIDASAKFSEHADGEGFMAVLTSFASKLLNGLRGK